MMEIAMRMPDLGAVDDTITVVKWLVEVGQPVRRGEPLLEVETDKSIMELESTVTGILQAINVSAGAEAAAGQVIATFGAEVGQQPEAVAPAEAELVAQTSAAAMPGTSAHPRRVAAGASVSFFERNRQTRAKSARASLPADYSRDFLQELYRRMVLIREFEEGVKFLFLEGAMPGTIHQCQGQEATAVGVCAALGESDYITSTFRGHGHALAKGLSP
jgi:pyruvate/2-oxoglutarate dehydrogenase complex dihydrolipoamide acyltransferase (E2) component